MTCNLATADLFQAEIARLQAEIERLREAIRRLAEQDATLSVCGGNVTVTMDATLTPEEREAVRFFSQIDGPHNVPVANKRAATLRSLLARTSASDGR
jgi:hypothetical protein